MQPMEMVGYFVSFVLPVAGLLVPLIIMLMRAALSSNLTDDLNFVIERFSDGQLIEVLARLHDLDPARAAYEECVRRYPGDHITLRLREQAIKPSVAAPEQPPSQVIEPPRSILRLPTVN